MRNEILEVSFDFAVEVIEYCEKLEANKKFVIAKQLLRSGTYVGRSRCAAGKAPPVHSHTQNSIL